MAGITDNATTAEWEAPMNAVLMIMAAVLAWAAPAGAQGSGYNAVFLCLQRMPAGTAEQMLDGCQTEVHRWLEACEQSRMTDVCLHAVAEEASLAASSKGVRP